METPEETLNELIKHHFKDNTNISDTHVNVTLQERCSSTTAEHKIYDDIFSPNRAKKGSGSLQPPNSCGPGWNPTDHAAKGLGVHFRRIYCNSKEEFQSRVHSQDMESINKHFFTKTR